MNEEMPRISSFRRFLRAIAPRFTLRRVALLALRDFLRRPRSLLNRFSAVNFHNHKVCKTLSINCIVCGSKSTMFYDFPDIALRREHGIGLLRETMNCRHCGSSMRDRQIANGLLSVINKRFDLTLTDLPALVRNPVNGLRILDSDSFSALNALLRGLPGYVHSQYVSDRPSGSELDDGSVNVDLQDMPFAERSFDIILTSDVMEHIFDYARAHREIYRCLDVDGSYVFTVPYNAQAHAHRNLTVETQELGVAGYLFLERHVHGDPHAASGILAHRIYGRELLSELEEIGFEPRFLSLDLPKHGIFGGDLFIAEKTS